ncbi:glycosyltransferase [Acerihabitans sp. TG2]|uniref:glycosyltransferase n=1 Tax=Acerihabitans sp. TG2 TaxID=3096008 RepID=UPI002B236594|nr:glycosyltransferase [Acerihabitans sp. TG2]MEA9392336.1 glycosyltransferase [Acerihabitans sp. TG2]
MRVLMIIDGLPGGGAEKVLLTIAQGMIADGHRLSLFSLRSVCDYTLPAGIHYQVVADTCRVPWRKLSELGRRAKKLDSAVIEAEDQDGKFDLVISHLHKTDRIVARSRALDPGRVWFCLHGMFSPSYLGHRRGFSRWFKRYKIGRVYRHRNITAVSRAVLEDMTGEFDVTPAKSAVINNPFDIGNILHMAAEPCDMAGQEYLIHVGRLHPHKRHDRLLRSYARTGIKTPLMIMGQGSDTELAALTALARELDIADRVIFKGFTANPYPYIKHARLLILSSDSEGFGNVLVEALICQTPVVSTRCPGGPAEILTGELARGLAEMSDESLSEKILTIFENPPHIVPQMLEIYDIAAISRKYAALAER